MTAWVRSLIVCTLLATALLHAQDIPTFLISSSTTPPAKLVGLEIDLANVPTDTHSFAFVVKKNGKLIVEAGTDGHVTYGDGITPDQAAVVFWSALAKWYPDVCLAKAPVAK